MNQPITNAKARALLVDLLTRDQAHGSTLRMSTEAAAEWVDAFLKPVGDDTPLFTGTADTATINTGVAFVLGDPRGGDDTSVACLWVGDED